MSGILYKSDLEGVQHVLLCVPSEVRKNNRDEDDRKRKGLSVDRMALQVKGYGIKRGSKGAKKKREKIIHSKKTGPGRILRACSPQCWISFTQFLHIYYPLFMTGVCPFVL